ncbi:hypothetical protein GCM10010104_34600 [Streptomyces indiaensis]|uniref:Uncharacterized protein n=1 Tax=Streptomyces indiaensis TaxID=284033 RepID=A0ABN3DMS1_9ACTN
MCVSSSGGEVGGAKPIACAGPARPSGARGAERTATDGPHPAHPAIRPYALLCENSFSTGTPTLCRAREAQSRWKNSST